ncbi:unnamed protein product [Ectocarpus sp. 4 AP-2014]
MVFFCSCVLISPTAGGILLISNPQDQTTFPTKARAVVEGVCNVSNVSVFVLFFNSNVVTYALQQQYTPFCSPPKNSTSWRKWRQGSQTQMPTFVRGVTNSRQQ